MKRGELIIFLIVATCFGAAIILFPSLPASMASHWDIKGKVNGYMPKEIGIFIIPVMMLIIALVFTAIPRIDPLKENINKFIEYYYWFAIMCQMFLTAIFVFVLLWNLGIRVKINFFLGPAFALLVFFMGVLIEKTKRNFFIGIRTPWTLSSDEVWEKTHKFAGTLIKAFSPLCVLSIFFEQNSFYFIMVAILLPLLIATVYSYKIWQKGP